MESPRAGRMLLRTAGLYCWLLRWLAVRKCRDWLVLLGGRITVGVNAVYVGERGRMVGWNKSSMNNMCPTSREAYCLSSLEYGVRPFRRLRSKTDETTWCHWGDLNSISKSCLFYNRSLVLQYVLVPVELSYSSSRQRVLLPSWIYYLARYPTKVVSIWKLLLMIEP